MILYMLNTACGIEEVAGLSWSKNINLDERTITIDHQLIYKNLDGSTRFQQRGMVRHPPLKGTLYWLILSTHIIRQKAKSRRRKKEKRALLPSHFFADIPLVHAMAGSRG